MVFTIKVQKVGPWYSIAEICTVNKNSLESYQIYCAFVCNLKILFWDLMDESIFHIFITYLGVPAIENVHLQVFSTTIRQIIILE